MNKKFIVNRSNLNYTNDQMLLPEIAIAIFNGRLEDRVKSNVLFNLYEGREETKLVQQQKLRSLTLIEAHVKARFSGTLSTQQQAMADKFRTELLQSCPLSINSDWKPGATAGNIADNYVERITNDPMPIETVEGTPENVVKMIEELQENSDWEETLKDIVLNAVICGVGVCMLTISKNINIIYNSQTDAMDEVPELKFHIESLSPVNCIFIKQGADILYAYYMPSDDVLNIFDKQKMYTFVKETKGWGQPNIVDHNFNAVPLRPVLFNSGKGCFEKCVNDIAAFDLSTYLMLCEANDPRASILLAGGSVENLMRSSVMQNVESKWLVKPDSFGVISELRKYCKANISESSKYVFIEDMVGGMETATKTREVISGFNSVMRSFGVNLQRSIKHLIRAFETYHKKSFNLRENISEYVVFDPQMQDIINIQDLFTFGRDKMSVKSFLKMLLGLSDEQAEVEWNRILLETSQIESARLSSVMPEAENFDSGVDRQ